MSACGYACMRACTPACLHASKCACVHSRMRVCVHECMRAYANARMRACSHACIRGCVYVCIVLMYSLTCFQNLRTKILSKWRWSRQIVDRCATFETLDTAVITRRATTACASAEEQYRRCSGWPGCWPGTIWVLATSGLLVLRICLIGRSLCMWSYMCIYLNFYPVACP